MQSKLLFEPLYLCGGIGYTSREHCATFGSENDILKYRKVLYKHKVLMHHTNPCGDRIGGVAYLGQFPVNVYLATISLVKAIEDAHEGRFACTVFTDDTMYGAFGDSKVDIYVGLYSAERFGDTS